MRAIKDDVGNGRVFWREMILLIKLARVTAPCEVSQAVSPDY